MSTATTNNDNHKQDQTTKSDNHDTHVWLLEPPTSHGVLTAEGLDQIVHHKYKAGTCTALDNWLNSVWQYLTDQLPLWLAPNAVTALGGGFVLLSYIVTAHYAFDLGSTEASIPNEVLILNGLCLIIYYTLDCMDGKQARRTQSSSPLGQLFDHGVDCLANLSHLSLMQAIVQWKAHHYILLQCCMQLGFFQAQLEEYYTGSLPHAAGNLGTTEVLYGMGVWSILTGVFGALGLVDRKALFRQDVISSWVPESIPLTATLVKLPGIHWVLNGDTSSVGAESLPLRVLQLKDLMIIIWVYGFVVLAVLSWIRLWLKITNDKKSTANNNPTKLGLSALSKWISPLILCALACDAVTRTSTAADTSSSMVMGSGVGVGMGMGGGSGIRYPSLAIGLAMCLLTIKLVVLGMARMSYAALQWVDVLPLMVVWALTMVLTTDHTSTTMTTTTTHSIKSCLYPLATAGYLVRLVWWTRAAVHPLCQRMKISLFWIPYSSENNHEKKVS